MGTKAIKLFLDICQLSFFIFSFVHFIVSVSFIALIYEFDAKIQMTNHCKASQLANHSINFCNCSKIFRFCFNSNLKWLFVVTNLLTFLFYSIDNLFFLLTKRGEKLNFKYQDYFKQKSISSNFIQLFVSLKIKVKILKIYLSVCYSNKQ